jgi:alginate O-acetyltransferase complex protein AlgI
MLFDSISFLVFFPVVAILYYILPQRFRWILLLAASCYFYMAFIPAYILILFYLITIDFIAGIYIEKSEGRRRTIFLIISIIANVGTLFFFKYFNFFNANVTYIAHLIHWNYSIEALMIALPLGLSFHTFQSLSYVIEVYYKRYPAERHIGIYTLYVMFFPQLVAGPIERPQQLLPQLHAKHEFEEGGVQQGLKLMLWGFFKKVVVADWIGVLVNTIYGNLHAANGVILCVAATAFSLQLYADFSGYSDIARGSAQVFGIKLVNNFDAPYFSKSIAEFWRRWHISLSSWFRDYFYYPLAFSLSENPYFRVYLGTFITFVVIGLWHGAAWTYIFMGAVFGFYIVFGMMTKTFRTRMANALGTSRFPLLYGALQTLVTFALVTIGWIFFRAPSLHDVLYILGHLGTGWGSITQPQFWSHLIFDPNTTGLTQSELLFVTISAIMMIAGESFERERHIVESLTAKPAWLRWTAYYAFILWILFFAYYKEVTFIYFKF